MERERERERERGRERFIRYSRSIRTSFAPHRTALRDSCSFKGFACGLVLRGEGKGGLWFGFFF